MNSEKKVKCIFFIQHINAVSSQKFGLWIIGECDVIDDAYAAVHIGLVERDAVGRKQTTAEQKRCEKICVQQYMFVFSIEITFFLWPIKRNTCECSNNDFSKECTEGLK